MYYSEIKAAYLHGQKQRGNQIYTDLEVETCDLSQEYFAKKDILKNIKDVDIYYCPKWKKNFNLKGVYGTTNFSFIFYAFGPCIQKHTC